MTGFKINEVMQGYHYFLGEEPRIKKPMRFDAQWGPEDTKYWMSCLLLGGPARCGLKGTVTIEGLCDKEPIAGSICLDYFGMGTITYSFIFSVNGIDYLYTGEKVNIKPWNLLTSHTTCFGTLEQVEYDELEIRNVELISRSVTFFKAKTVPGFLGSFRLT